MFEDSRIASIGRAIVLHAQPACHQLQQLGHGFAKLLPIVGGKRYQVPTDWGTEAIAFDTTQAPQEYGKTSYGNLWAPDMTGKVTVRGHSALVGLGLWLEANGKLPKPMRDSFKDEATMRANYDVILAEAMKHKSNIAQFWSNENEAQGAFRSNGCILGQTWDSTAGGLRKARLDRECD